MDRKLKSAASDREYEDVDPVIEIAKEEDCDTLLVKLPGFTKEQLKLQLTTPQNLKLTGERPLANNKWLLLQREYPVSTDCDTSKITARFENGVLKVRQPKSVLSPAVKGEKGNPASETQKTVIEAQKPAIDQPRPQKPNEKPASEIQKPNEKPADDQPRPQKPDQKKPTNDQPRPQQSNDEETESMVDQSKQKEGKKSESVDAGSVDKGDLERKKGEEGKRSGVDEDAGGRTPPLVVAGRRPMGKGMNMVVGILLVLVIGIYVVNWMKPLPWNMESES